MQAEECFESGILYAHILHYLQQELALVQTGASTFSYGRALICLRQLPPRPLGAARLPRTEVRLAGDEADIAEFRHAFLMRFLSAGG